MKKTIYSYEKQNVEKARKMNFLYIVLLTILLPVPVSLLFNQTIASIEIHPTKSIKQIDDLLVDDILVKRNVRMASRIDGSLFVPYHFPSFPFLKYIFTRASPRLKKTETRDPRPRPGIGPETGSETETGNLKKIFSSNNSLKSTIIYVSA